jgi:predicted 3-demethylubiquinone-9 3-methyltransferase (glyoxalase superfamily)
MTKTPTLKTFLWFNGNLDAALDFYSKTFDGVIIHNQNRPDPNGPIFTADFSIFGHEFIGLNWPGGPEFNDSISLSINCDGQEEVDRYWNAITERGKAGQCGWCVDEFGLSWQVSPIQMRDWLGHPDPEIASYAMTAMRQMGKIVIDELHA